MPPHMASVFSSYDSIRIVNLASRTDRRRQMERELAGLGLRIGGKVSFFPAIRCDDAGPFLRVGSNGAYRSHLAILREARDAGQSVLILQDDCQFLPEARDWPLPVGTDIFYGGYEASDPDDLHGSEIIGAHFMGFSAAAVRLAVPWLEALLDPAFPPDPQAAAKPGFDPRIRPPIDGALVWFRRAHPELRTEFAMLSIQRSSRTDIGDARFFDRIPVLNRIAGWARDLRAAWRER